MNIESTGNAQEETVFFYTTGQQKTTEKEIWKGNEEARNTILNDPPVITVSCHYANDLHKDTAIVNIAQLTKASRILIEQDSDPTLLKFKREMLELPFDEQILLNDARYMHYSRKKNVSSSKMIYFAANTKMISAKSVTYRSFAWTITQSVITNITKNSWQTPRHFRNDERILTLVLLSFNCNIRQKLGL